MGRFRWRPDGMSLARARIRNSRQTDDWRVMANGWTLERRARQAKAIRRWRPWRRSTGPRTAEGKAGSARNADRGGHRARWSALVTAWRRWLRSLEELTDDQGRSRSED